MPTIVDTIIENALAKADTSVEASAKATNAITELLTSRANTMGGGLINSNWFMKIPVTAVEPAVPEVENSLFTYEAQAEKLIGMLSNELAGYFTKYYPLASDAFDEANSWLVNAITNGGTGIKKEIEDQIYQRGRERLIFEGARQENKIASGFAAKGWSLPPGAMVAAIQEARFVQMGAVGEQATSIAAKQAEMEIENIRFAVAAAVESRFKAMSAAADYIRALMTAPDAAARVAALNADAKARMMSATADLYRSRLTRDQLVLNTWGKQMELTEHYNIAREQDENTKFAAQIDGSRIAAEAYAKVASAALSSLTAIASTSQLATS